MTSRRIWRLAGVAFTALFYSNTLAAELAIVPEQTFAGPDLFNANCAVCHGEELQGAPQGTPLIGRELTGGESMDALRASISAGSPDKGMPAWSSTLDAEAVKTLAMFIIEYRNGWSGLNMLGELEIDESPIDTQQHRLRLEPLARGLDPKPYSIAVMPDGTVIVTEKMYGLRTITPEGEVSALVKGTPRTHADVFATAEEGSVEFGAGWVLDVALHPDFESNGWVYLHYTERCATCGDVIKNDQNVPTSQNVLVRGRIKDGRWVDQETIWKPDIFDHNYYLDVVAGGRIAFDPEGYVFITVGMRSMDAIQDLASPYGKTHRFRDDGAVPSDNPYVGDPTAYDTIWTVGHRSPQGLAFNPRTRELWGTEHGPRGGDELNRLLPGRNYGWPLFSAGQNYDGSVVAHGRTASELELADTEQPTVGWTPSIAISNLLVYDGAAFPGWRGDFLIGSLKASDLYRVRFGESGVVEQETVVENIGRIRDLDVDRDGVVYLLVEHASGTQIVKVVPD